MTGRVTEPGLTERTHAALKLLEGELHSTRPGHPLSGNNFVNIANRSHRISSTFQRCRLVPATSATMHCANDNSVFAPFVDKSSHKGYYTSRTALIHPSSSGELVTCAYFPHTTLPLWVTRPRSLTLTSTTVPFVTTPSCEREKDGLRRQGRACMC